MKHKERKTLTADFITSVECDVTGESCEELPHYDGDASFFDYGVLKYVGWYGSPYDLLEIELELHPDLVVALFLLSGKGKAMAGKDWPYKNPKFKITIEEQNENESPN